MTAVARPVQPDTANRGFITLSVMLATIMQALDTTIANVALPHMQGAMGATQDQISWVLTSYIVAAAIFMPLTGFLASRFGRKRLFMGSVIGFTVASMLCGAAQSLPEIVLFRLLQGVFGASLVPLSQSVLLDAYPREQAWQGHGHVGRRRDGRADSRPHARRLAHRVLQLALGVLHQPALRAVGLAGFGDLCQGNRDRPLAPFRPAGVCHVEPGNRRPADDAGPRRVAGLVRQPGSRDRGHAHRPVSLPLRRAHVHPPGSPSSSRGSSATATSASAWCSSSSSASSCSPRWRCCRLTCSS